MKLGAYPEMSLDEARVRTCGSAPMWPKATTRSASGAGPANRQPEASGAPTFGHCADQHIALNEGGWKNSKHHAQWVATLKTYAAPIRSNAGQSRSPPPTCWRSSRRSGTTSPRRRQRLARPHRGGLGLGSGRWLDSRGPAEPGAVEELARPQIAQAEEARLTRPPQGAALRSIARPHGAARGDRQRRGAGVADSPS